MGKRRGLMGLSALTAFLDLALLSLPIAPDAAAQTALDAGCPECAALDGFVTAHSISEEVWAMLGMHAGGGEAVAIQKARGVIETGLEPLFAGGVRCRPIDSEQWAIDYTPKRGKPALHKGIDIPAPRGTPILAAAAGQVGGRFGNADNPKGIEMVLRHSPEDTGLQFWTYSQYTHLDEMPSLAIGARISMGDPLGATGNTGASGRGERGERGERARNAETETPGETRERDETANAGPLAKRRETRQQAKRGRGLKADTPPGGGGTRRDALHFAVLYAERPEFANDGIAVAPLDGRFMDPVAFYRENGPYDSPTMTALPAAEKAVPVAYRLENGTVHPAAAKRIWPYACQLR